MRKTLVPSLWKLVALFCIVALMMPTATQAQTSTLPTAAQVASQIDVGWNLGNTLEAICGETAWGNPAASQQLITAVKNAGFNAIRIPAAWDCHANQSTLTIDAAWLARVKQVVDYAVNNGMYVILNIHWDGGWLEEHPLYSYQEAVNQKQNAYWTQIANYFKSVVTADLVTRRILPIDLPQGEVQTDYIFEQKPEELLKTLFDPLLRRLRTELRLDRERRGVISDRW